MNSFICAKKIILNGDKTHKKICRFRKTTSGVSQIRPLTPGPDVENTDCQLLLDDNTRRHHQPSRVSHTCWGLWHSLWCHCCQVSTRRVNSGSLPQLDDCWYYSPFSSLETSLSKWNLGSIRVRFIQISTNFIQMNSRV
jgi:hypothetical protein